MIFDTTKTVEDYTNVKLFNNGGVGLLDSINLRFTKVFDLYKEMKALDWDEQEFDHSQSLVDFKRVHADTSDIMIKNIAWQWETDSVASQIPFHIIAPYSPCSEIVAGELRINDNETIHAFNYSEIVKMSFDNPNEVLSSILKDVESFKRLGVVGGVLKDLQKRSAALSYLGPVALGYSEINYVEDMMLFYFVMYVLERIQFMSSFGITFTICESGAFQSIGNSIKKICQDEFEVHCEFRLEILRNLIQGPFGKEVFEKLRPTFINIVKEVIQVDFDFIEWVFDGGKKSLVGTNMDIVKKWTLFNVAAVNSNFELGLEDFYEMPRSNPMPHLDKWIDINKTQTANQETNNTQYKVNIVRRNDTDIIYTF